tara:strand:- start:825 stop:2531 length:1707 start_codon:yes stop_codon:yes gene_type:complete
MQKHLTKFIIYFSLLFSFLILLYKFNNQHIIGIDEFKYVDWSLNLFSAEAVLDYFRPFFYLITNISLNLFGLTIIGLKLPNILFFLISSYLIIKICKKYYTNEYTLLIPLIFFLFNPFILTQHTLLGPFSISNLLIITNLLFVFDSIDKKENNINYFILGIINSLSSLCREELIFFVFINILFIYIINKDFKKIIIYISGFLLINFLFLFIFFQDIEFKKIISILLSVIDKEISSPVRNIYYRLDQDITFEPFLIIPENIDRLFSNFFYLNEILIIIFPYFFIFYFIRKKSLDIKTKYLLFTILIFSLFYLYIRVSDRLFVFFEFYFILILCREIEKINLEKFIKLKFIFSIFIILSIVKIFYNLNENKYKPLSSLNNELNKLVVENYDIDENIFISPTSSLIHKPQKYFGTKPSENFSLSSKLFFNENVFLFQEIINKKDLQLKDYINELNIKFIIIENYQDGGELILEKKDILKISNFLNLSLEDQKKYFSFDLKNYQYLIKYGANLDDYFLINIDTFNELVIRNLDIKKIYFLRKDEEDFNYTKEQNFKIIKNYNAEVGLYLLVI